MQEEWKTLPGHDAYEVSNLGAVRSIDRVIVDARGLRRRLKGKKLKLIPDGLGYFTVNIGIANPMRVHELVMLAFVGPRPDGKYICHYDGNGKNNALTNLRYDTAAGNSKDTVRLNRSARGEAVAGAKLTSAQVVQIRRSTAGNRVLAKIYGISEGTIRFIRNRQTWAWLDVTKIPKRA